MAEIHISSDKGIMWGNHLATPERIVEVIGSGVSILNGLLCIDTLKIVNRVGDEYLVTADGKRLPLTALFPEFEEA